MSGPYEVIPTEPGLWTVLFRIPGDPGRSGCGGRTEADSDHGDLETAERRARWLNGTLGTYVYRRSEERLWTVGWYDGHHWDAIKDFGTQEVAARETAWMNGSSQPHFVPFGPDGVEDA